MLFSIFKRHHRPDCSARSFVSVQVIFFVAIALAACATPRFSYAQGEKVDSLLQVWRNPKLPDTARLATALAICDNQNVGFLDMPTILEVSTRGIELASTYEIKPADLIRLVFFEGSAHRSEGRFRRERSARHQAAQG